MPSTRRCLTPCVRPRFARLAMMIVLCLAPAAPGQDPARTAPPTDPAAQIDSDPLFRKSRVTFQDLQTALADPARRDNAIQRHFARATELTDDQRRDLLQSALKNPSWQVRQQAVDRLVQSGWLKPLVRKRVTEAGFQAELAFRDAALPETSRPLAPPEVVSPEYISALVQDLKSPSAQKQFAAGRQLEALGPVVVPDLLQALSDPDLATPAAALLGRIVVAGEPAVVAEHMPAPDIPVPEAFVGTPMPKAVIESREAPELVREVDPFQPTTVRVHFGTNREVISSPVSAEQHLKNGVAAMLLALIVSWYIYRRYRGRHSDAAVQQAGCGMLVPAGLLVLAAAWGLVQLNTGWRQHYSEHQGATFGGHRAPGSQISFGYCDVSIPPTHQVGEVEHPKLGAEDERDHVVLKRTQLQRDQEFFDAVRSRLTTGTNGQCFVFVHGFNVTFDDAARRTAQIHYDLRFEGVPIFFSWPSRGSFRHYFSDRNEILVSRQAIRQFLSDVANRTSAEKIHVIAHSMGADAVCQAIAELDGKGRIFEQVILAAPDIDAEVFEFQLLPKMKPRARRTTLYCSRNDLALYASNRFNDSRRAGDSSVQLVLSEGLDTVDASDMDTELLGHSYYGSCQPLIDDVRQILTANLPPPERQLEPRPMGHVVPAWTFRPWDPDARSADPQDREQP